jgi:hypothetical protein
MSLALKVHSNVADAATGRLRGRVRKVLEAPHKERLAKADGAAVLEPASEGRFVVEWEDGRRSEVTGDGLVARYSSHSQGWKPF